MHAIYKADVTDAVFLIDASNAFNVLNREQPHCITSAFYVL